MTGKLNGFSSSSSLAMFSVAARAPAAPGVNCTVNVALDPAATLAGTPVATKSAACVPLKETLETVSTAPPGLRRVKLRVVLCGTGTLPKSTAVD